MRSSRDQNLNSYISHHTTELCQAQLNHVAKIKASICCIRKYCNSLIYHIISVNDEEKYSIPRNALYHSRSSKYRRHSLFFSLTAARCAGSKDESTVLVAVGASLPSLLPHLRAGVCFMPIVSTFAVEYDP